MAVSREFDMQMREMWPRTFSAIVRLADSMAKAHNSTGRRSIFGKEKGPLAHAEFLRHLQLTVREMYNDNLLKPDSTPEEAMNMVVGSLRTHEAAIREWDAAYAYLIYLVGAGDLPSDVVDAIQRAAPSR